MKLTIFYYYFFRLILVQPTVTPARMVHRVLRYSKEDINANVYLAGKDNFVRSILMIVLKSLASLEHLVQIW